MTLMHFFLVGTHIVAIGGGYYLHYRFGAAVAADVAKVKSVV